MTRIFGVHQQNTDIELQSAQLFHQLSASYKSLLQPAWFCHRESVSVSTQEVNVQLAAPALICSHSVVSCVPRASMHPWQQALSWKSSICLAHLFSTEIYTICQKQERHIHKWSSCDRAKCCQRHLIWVLVRVLAALTLTQFPAYGMGKEVGPGSIQETQEAPGSYLCCSHPGSEPVDAE